MSKQNDVQNAINSAYYFLKFRPRTKKEVERNLQKKAAKYRWSETIIVDAIKYLEEQNLINDQDFIKWFVDQRSRAKPKSEYALRNELMKLGVPKDLLDMYFSENEQDEETLAAEALSRRWAKFRYLDKQTRFKKIASFLSNRGFSFDIIKKTIAKYEEKGYNKVDY